MRHWDVIASMLAMVIDVHTHFVPDFWREATTKAGFGKPDGMPGIPAWSEEAHLELMQQANISKAILSITSPGTYLIPGNYHEARRLSRKSNEFAADLKWRRPDQFGFWAVLPLPDVEGSLVELAYALDHLNADGVVIFTNNHGIYPGDKLFEPVFHELNRRNATIFIHPTSPCIYNNNNNKDAPDQHHHATQQVIQFQSYPNPMLEFFFESARTIASLFLTNTVNTFPRISYIISHAGGAFPPSVERFSYFASALLDLPFEVTSDSVKEVFARQFYFDLAGLTFPDQIYGLLRYVGARRIVYGSDFPYTPGKDVVGIAGVIDEGIAGVFPDQFDRENIFSGNAETILARG
ncbi:hypothetical protein BJX62DRAFT_228001 [Aspergillus germanicus]